MPVQAPVLLGNIASGDGFYALHVGTGMGELRIRAGEGIVQEFGN
jgi:hypothetical protein